MCISFYRLFLYLIFKKIRSLKNEPHIGIPAGFTGPDGLNYGVKKALIQGALVPIR
jgi:hypothetical protein